MNLLYIASAWQLKDSKLITQCVPSPHSVVRKNSATSTLADITLAIHKANKRGMQIHGIIVSDGDILAQYLTRVHDIDLKNKKESTLDAYQGAMFEHPVTINVDTTEHGSVPTTYHIPVVIVGDPQHIAYNAQHKFLTTRFISKLYDTSWLTTPKLDWQLLDEYTAGAALAEFSGDDVLLISTDIETRLNEIPSRVSKAKTINSITTEGMWYTGYARTESNNKANRLAELMPIITCVGYTAIFSRNGKLSSKTVVLPMTSMKMVAWMRKYNSTPAPKVMQNGRYDATYFLRYNAPLHNWAFDTYGMMHSYYVELKRGLHNVSAFFLRNHMYWKDESHGSLYEYNAKDCHATAWACVSMLNEMPDWAINNFVMTFKQVFPAVSCALEGWKQDEEEATKLWQHYQNELVKNQDWWDTVLCEDFNTNSPIQVKQLFQKLLGTGVAKCDKPTLLGIIHKHPLWRLMIEKLIATREAKKADSTYMNIITYSGRVLFSLDPFGTDTCRYASKASEFWVGTQIQNIPGYAKSQFISDDGYETSAIDNAQSESRTTAYITGDEKLIDAVENAKDFHTRNACMFFGITEEQMFKWKDEGNPLYKKYRNKIGKRVNHGANYNMGPNVLINTMTPLGIIEAQHTLKLPSRWTFVDVATYLLDCFDEAYPLIRSKEEGGFHHMIMTQVAETSKLVSPDGWTRYTFLDPANSKRHLNQLVAHLPQCWSVRSINKAFFDSWHQYQIVENVARFKAQVHDEIIFQTLPEHTAHVTAGVSKLMAAPNYMYGTDEYMVIPNDPAPPAHRWSQLKD